MARITEDMLLALLGVNSSELLKRTMREIKENEPELYLYLDRNSYDTKYIQGFTDCYYLLNPRESHQSTARER